MLIGGLQKNSLIDYPGKIAFCIFTIGCNMNCYYCHNRKLIKSSKENIICTADDVLAQLLKRKNFIDALVITGGEPTVQKDLEVFIAKVKELGLLVKLDTNGTNPEIIKSLLEKKLVDYIAMDIKAPIDKYDIICGIKVNTEKIKQSISIIKSSGIEYEFRTTAVPQLDFSDFEKIAKILSGTERFAIQQYRLTDEMKEYKDLRLYIRPHSKADLLEIKELCEKQIKSCTVRGI